MSSAFTGPRGHCRRVARVRKRVPPGRPLPVGPRPRYRYGRSSGLALRVLPRTPRARRGAHRP
ncbi:hypothetical protein K701_08820 [Streptomyces fradiae ATCC 10745 = DSM 40063]|uniref:Uncharacterized protein n=1 Tax=Streptomyces fradiae ATCC 10745 = DSM 40063 TaxID=1319510 RepID=A0ABQ6XX37_STRFR|nr:hypothetical protein K701_08820 [Streptomyces fradiae ATCC 10745 = DSM 40063]QEV12313.1 hypothetical protein CP974_10045 [Streptomyces fradiae ATCC 10745 = DSM 40063]